MNPAKVNAIRDFCEKTTSILTFDQLLLTNSNIQQLLSTTESFSKDNELLEKISQKKDTAQNLGMKESDVELYSQLMKMYRDYLMKLCNLKKESNILNKDLIKYDYLNNSVFPQILLNCDPNDVRTEYVQQLIEITKNTDLATKFFSKKKAKFSATGEKASANTPLPTSSTLSTSASSTLSNSNSKTTSNKSTAGTVTKKPKKEITTVKVSLKRSNPTVVENKSDKVELKKRKKLKTDSDEVVKKREIPVAIRTSSSSTTSVKSKKQLSFNTENVTVFGHDLPKKGVQVSFKNLKQALNKEKKASIPKERLLVDSSKINVLKLAPFSDINCIPQCDISELKGGVVKLQTEIKPEYRTNFRNFSKNLNKEHTEKEFHSQNEEVKEENEANNQPIVMPAFGQNQLLLLNDRGKLPYRSIPEVRPNAYPPVSKL
ncbi:hypothetical protein ACO0QE_002646 [Hanseniaspora vineae]